MPTLAIVLGSVGAILLMVGLVGGGFEFSGTVMPQVGGLSRLTCSAAGGLLVVFAIGLGLLDPALNLTPEPDDPVVVSSGSPSTTVDQQVGALLRNRPSFSGLADADLRGIGLSTCDGLDSGLRGRDLIEEMERAGASQDDAVYAFAVFTTAYCPAYATADVY